MPHTEKVLLRHNILGSRHAEHIQLKSLGRNIKNEAATRKQAKWRQTFWVVTEMTIMQDSVVTRTRT